jgi:hypothetical protein
MQKATVQVCNGKMTIRCVCGEVNEKNGDVELCPKCGRRVFEEVFPGLSGMTFAAIETVSVAIGRIAKLEDAFKALGKIPVPEIGEDIIALIGRVGRNEEAIKTLRYRASDTEARVAACYTSVVPDMPNPPPPPAKSERKPRREFIVIPTENTGIDMSECGSGGSDTPKTEDEDLNTVASNELSELIMACPHCGTISRLYFDPPYSGKMQSPVDFLIRATPDASVEAPEFREGMGQKL